MDAFEELVAGLLRQQGYWTWQGYKVELTREQKKSIDNPSIPRPEIDILAYRPSENVLLWVECKSYLDSKGVVYEHLADKQKFDPTKGRYKIFTNDLYRNIVSQRLKEQLRENHPIYGDPNLKYCLVTGNIYHKSACDLQAHFAQNGWLLYDREWIKDQLYKLADSDYENNVAAFVAKLLNKETPK